MDSSSSSSSEPSLAMILPIATAGKKACHCRRLLRLVAASALVLVAARLPQTATAFPTGPGGCPAGMSATTNGHAALNPVPTFAQLGYSLLVNGQVVNATTTLQVGQRYEITVRSTLVPFRGALIRVTGQGMLAAGQNSGTAQACTNIMASGVGHVDRNEKSLLSGFFTPSGGTSVTFDVTVVEANSARNVYSYQAFTLAVRTGAPVPAPTPAPTRLADRSPAFWAALINLWRQLASFVRGMIS